MIKKILIANRGEIAIRIIRACRELQITTVAIYSQADKNSLHVSLADEAYCIGPADSLKSYLSIPAIISVALTSGADAIHPGYGFLAERADFSEICKEHNIKFIGPSAASMRKLADKATARKTMKDHKVPIVPGTDIIEKVDDIKKFGKKAGYPIILKPTAGGGGKGMRVIYSEKEIQEAFDLCQAEAKNSFGNEQIYCEKYLENPRHIEFQVLADKYGNVIHLGERDCSIQRRHQKLIEEAPCVAINDDLRKKMGRDAVNAVKAIGYEGVCTVEFLLDGKDYYFMEMNTRIQVEHPITEMITGVDIVKEQIKIASKLKMTLKQDDIKIQGHAIECRINAENPEKNFMPQPGKIEGYIAPGGIGVRVDSHAYSGYSIPPNYDSLISKVICWGNTREEARLRMLRALGEYIITGIHTTIPFHQKVLNNSQFINAKIDTNFVEKDFVYSESE